MGSHRTGTLENTSVAEITEKLGFQPNIEDDPDKVEFSWGFTADGEHCGIWDYKGGARYGIFSTFGPKEIFKKLFGEKYL